ncbi:MAG: hypothetical protein PHP74_02620, partial [Candidatus Gracilibacteria bacterium]|nr:hypothetical protein [Candidatus Gracilibacteria bacterium]
MKTFSHLALNNLISESRLVHFAGGHESSPFREVEKAPEGLTLEKAKELADKALKEVKDKAKEWAISDDQSAQFKELASRVSGELDAEYKTWIDLVDTGVDKPLTPEQLVEFKSEFGSKLETKLATLTEDAETDAEAERIRAKKEEL